MLFKKIIHPEICITVATMCKNKILKLQFTTLLGGIMFSRGNEHRETVWCLPGSLPQRKPGFPDHRITRHYFPHLQRAGEFKEEDFFVLRKNSGNKNDILLGTKYIAVIILDGEPSWLI